MSDEADTDLTTMPLPKVKELLNKAEGDVADAKTRVAIFQAELVRRYGESFKQNFADNAKLHGDITLELDGEKLKGSVDKEVKWDTKLLMPIASTLAWPQVTELFKIEFSVPEATYNALKGANPELYNKITAARTVKFKPLKVTFKGDKKDA